MKNEIPVLILLSFLIFSCKKSNPTSTANGLLSPPYYFTCKVGGSVLNFTSAVSCHLPTGGDTVIDGNRESSVTFNLKGTVNSSNQATINISITGSNNFAITTNSYIYPSVQIGCVYEISNTNFVGTAAYYSGGSDSINFSPLKNEFQLTVSSIDMSHQTIMGSFDGILAGNNGMTLQLDTVGITEGKFYLPYYIP